MEQGLFKFSMSGLVGARMGKKGFEIGCGPNLSFGNDPFSPLAIVLAAGYSLKTETVIFPINLAFVIPTNEKIKFRNASGLMQEKIISTGPRISLLFGCNMRRRGIISK